VAATRLFVATRNAKKLRELAERLLGANVRLVGAGDVPGVPEVDETGATFEENAHLKAVSASLHTQMLSLADDSGLEVDALGGAPGVKSARYASTGPGNASDEANRAKLLVELAGVDAPRRTARFRCAIAVARGGKVLLQSTGTVEGRILSEERGDGGFGYDPLFVPTGFDRTFAEMTGAEKAAISHRARAIAALAPGLQRLLSALD
jgi:XTP/dITP diphosphohydrolase